MRNDYLVKNILMKLEWFGKEGYLSLYFGRWQRKKERE